MSRDLYLRLLRDLLSGDPARLRSANRELYGQLVVEAADDETRAAREADLVLADVA